MAMKFAVIVVTYNRRKLLQECIEAIFNQERFFDDIVIVDNGSNDGTKEYLEQYKDLDKIRILSFENNRGGAFGFSEGLKEVVNHEIDWILLIDDDAILNLDFLKKTEDFIKKDKSKQGAYSCSVLTFNEIYTRHRTRHILKNFFWLKSVPLREYEKEYFDCEIATFCGLIVSKDIVKKIGYPKSEYFIWEDDEEYCERIYKLTNIRNINHVILNHKTGKSFNTLNWKMYYGARNIIDSVKTHYGVINLVFCVLRLVLRCIKYMIFSKKYLYKKRDILRMYVTAICDGLHGNLGINENYYPNKEI